MHKSPPVLCQHYQTKDELLKSALCCDTQTWIPSNNFELLNSYIEEILESYFGARQIFRRMETSFALLAWKQKEDPGTLIHGDGECCIWAVMGYL